MQLANGITLAGAWKSRSSRGTRSSRCPQYYQSRNVCARAKLELFAEDPALSADGARGIRPRPVIRYCEQALTLVLEEVSSTRVFRH